MTQPKRRAALGLPLRKADAMVASTAFSVVVEGQHLGVGVGDWLHKDDPLVAEFPDSFETAEKYEERVRREQQPREEYLAEVNKADWE